MDGAIEFHGHDHFPLPKKEVWKLDTHDPTEFISKEELAKLNDACPSLKERNQRMELCYHIPHYNAFAYYDHVLVGFHIEEAVYAPLYYGYGGPGQYAYRSTVAREIEQKFYSVAPDVVLVLLKASPEVIGKRMRENRHSYNVIKEEDIDYLLKRFDEEYKNSLIRRKFIIDTSSNTIIETMQQFLTSMKRFFTPIDILRILLARVKLF